MPKRLRPGNSWKHLGGPVWEHISGVRIHTMGVVRLPDMTFHSDCEWPICQESSLLIRINGGNKKRGLMAWALKLLDGYC